MFPVYRINSVPSSEHGYHSPLEGESQKSSRMAKADAEGGSHKASQRRDLVRRRGFAQPKLQAKADAEGVRTSQAVRRRSCAP